MKKYSELSLSKKQEVLRELVLRCRNEQLPHGAIAEAARKIAVNRSTISRVWKEASQASEFPYEIFFDVSPKTSQRGRKPTFFDIHT